MTTVGMHYDVLPGKEDAFERAFESVLDVLKSCRGHVLSKLYRDVAAQPEGGSYVIISEWERAEDFSAFIQSDAFRGTTAWGKAEILRGRPRHKVYQS